MEQKRKISKYLGLTGISVSFLFFFNPNINLIDIFPDFIGYIILCSSLRILADLHDDLNAARKNFRYLLLLDIVKNLAIFWLFGLSVNTERNTGMLLLCFAFGVGELLLLIPAYSKLFGGLMTLAYVHPSHFVLERSKPSAKKSFTEKICKQTVFFVILKVVMAVLPEFSNLNSYEYDETGSVSHSLYEYIGLLRTAAFLLTLFFGIIWLVRVLTYFGKLRKDREYLLSLCRHYEANVLPRRGIFVSRSVRAASFLFLIGSIFLIDFRLDGLNLLPDAVGVAFFLGGIFVLKPYLTLKMNRLYLMLGSYSVLTVIAYAVDFYFYRKYYYGAIFRNLDAYYTFVITVIASVLASAGMILLLMALRYVFFDLIDHHTGFTGHSLVPGDDARIQSFHKEQKKSLRLLYVFGGMAIASDIFRSIWENEFGFSGFLGLVFSAAFTVALFKRCYELVDHIETKYMLE